MTIERLLQYLYDSGVVLTVVGKNLRIDAPRGVITTAVRKTIKAYKWELIAIMTLFAPEDIEKFYINPPSSDVMESYSSHGPQRMECEKNIRGNQSVQGALFDR